MRDSARILFLNRLTRFREVQTLPSYLKTKASGDNPETLVPDYWTTRVIVTGGMLTSSACTAPVVDPTTFCAAYTVTLTWLVPAGVIYGVVDVEEHAVRLRSE